MDKLTDSQVSWSLGKRFRTLLGIYFIFLMLDFTSSDELFPHFVYVIMQPYTDFWNWIVPWTGSHILNLSPITIKPNGSGDTTYNYVLQLLWIVFSFVIASIWVIIDRKRPSYGQIRYWLRILVRYFLAYMLFVYGFVKVVKLQFPFPDLIRLTEPYGDSSPMGLAWAFVGYSKGYNLFTGGAEVLAGVLLFYKRTTLFGSLVSMTVMANIVAMNFAYDIPVKIFSLNLLFMSIWLAWHDKDRLINFFFLNKDTTAARTEYGYQTKWKKIVQLTLKSLTIISALYATLWTNIDTSKTYGDKAKKPPLYGIYNVNTFEQNGRLRSPLTTDSLRWKKMIIAYSGYTRITKMNDSTFWLKTKIDTISKTLNFTSNEDPDEKIIFKYLKIDSAHLLLDGKMGKDSVKITMQRFDLNKFPLVNRGFHWINEYPNNK